MAKAKSTESTTARVVLHEGSDGVAIVFPPDRDPGVHAFGALKPGVEYVVSPAEAKRLTAESRAPARRFDYVSAADAKASTAAKPASTEE